MALTFEYMQAIADMNIDRGFVPLRLLGQDRLKRPWAFVTNGHVFLAVRDCPAAMDPRTQDAALWAAHKCIDLARLEAFAFGAPVEDTNWTVGIDLASLAAFAGAPAFPEIGECPCKGTRAVKCPTCRGTGQEEVSCDECDHVHHHTCPNCDGEGTIDCKCGGTGRVVTKWDDWASSAVRVLGGQLDARYLAVVLGWDAAGPARACWTRGYGGLLLLLEGEGWRAGIAGLNTDSWTRCWPEEPAAAAAQEA